MKDEISKRFDEKFPQEPNHYSFDYHVKREDVKDFLRSELEKMEREYVGCVTNRYMDYRMKEQEKEFKETKQFLADEANIWMDKFERLKEQEKEWVKYAKEKDLFIYELEKRLRLSKDEVFSRILQYSNKQDEKGENWNMWDLATAIITLRAVKILSGEDIYSLCGGLELSTQRKVAWWELSPNWRDFYNRIAKAIIQLQKEQDTSHRDKSGDY